MNSHDKKEFVSKALMAPVRDLQAMLQSKDTSADQAKIIRQMLAAIATGDVDTMDELVACALGE